MNNSLTSAGFSEIDDDIFIDPGFLPQDSSDSMPDIPHFDPQDNEFEIARIISNYDNFETLKTNLYKDYKNKC